MKRIAIPVNDNILSEYFGQCSHYEIFEIEGEKITHNKVGYPPHHDVTRLPEWAAQQGITDVITYKIDNRIISRFINNKINLFIGVPLLSPDILIDDYLNGRLKSDEKIIKEIQDYQTEL